jgi:replicative DNA helicase
MEPVRNIQQSASVSRTQIVSLERGKLPPQAIELEEAVLGALMIDRKADEVFDVFTNPNVFYKDAHKVIFEACAALSANGEPIDMMTVSAELKKRGMLQAAGGDYYLIQLTQKISSSAHIEFHARIILQKWAAREVIRKASESIEMAYDDTVDVFDLMDHAEQGFASISDGLTTGKQTKTWGQMLDAVVQNVETLTKHGDKILGVPTGFWKLDAHFGGWQPTDLIIWGARPGAGKTALTVAVMIGAASAGSPVGYFSLEMSGVQLATRGVAVNSNYHLNQLTRHGFEKDEYFANLITVVNAMKRLPIHIDDSPTLTLMELRRKVRRMVQQQNVKLVFVDYLQLAAGTGSDVRHGITEWCYGLKAIAKEHNITIIALSQLNREVDRRGVPRPKISDLAEASAIEAAADAICFIYRPAMYKLEPEYKSEGGELVPGENTEFIVAKYRHGGVGTIGLWYDGNKTKFSDEQPEYDNTSHPVSHDNWEQKAQARTALPTPSPADAFGAPGYSITDASTNPNPDDDVPF